MIHFRSKAGADVMMLQAHAERVLTALGREPAPQGIFLPEQIEEALATFRQALPAPAEPGGEPEDESDPGPAPDLARRAWPLLSLLQAAARGAVPVTWSSS